ncbi:unnamed protein product, partial [Meganyctiphanes norvegica]
VDISAFPMLHQENFGQVASASGSVRTGHRRRHQYSSNWSSSNNTSRGHLRCNLCNFTAKYQSRLMRHMATHTGERPHICPYCPYSAAQKGDLDRHLRRHTGERPYVCSYCPYSATRKHLLIAHLNNHTNSTSSKLI